VTGRRAPVTVGRVGDVVIGPPVRAALDAAGECPQVVEYVPELGTDVPASPEAPSEVTVIATGPGAPSHRRWRQLRATVCVVWPTANPALASSSGAGASVDGPDPDQSPRPAHVGLPRISSCQRS